MDPATMAALAQMGMNFQQGLGSAIGGNSGDWGNALQGIPGLPGVIGGVMSSRSAKKKKRKAQKRFDRALKVRESVEGRGLQQQEALARQATAQNLAGFDAAKREAATRGQASKQAALDREKTLGASLTQNLQNRGLGSLTTGGNIQRGLAADTQRTIGGINEGLGGMFGDLALGRAGAEAQGTANIANIAGQQTDLMSQLAQMRLLGGATAGPTGTFDPGSWADAYRPNTGAGMMEGLGSAMGSFGGMGGAGGGGQMDLMAMLQKLFSQQPGNQFSQGAGQYGPIPQY